MPPPLEDESSDVVQTANVARTASITDVLLDRRVLALLVSFALGGPVASAAVTSYTGGASIDTVEEAMGDARTADSEILEKVSETNTSVDKLATAVGGLATQQRQLDESINGDSRDPDKPGIKGTLKRHNKKLDSLKKDIERIKKRDEKRDELEKLDKGLRDFPLAREELWERPE